ncbi:MAG: D-alanine--D-alanine ligase [Verrucomicrobia bacterium]|nr:D-alanine--D-alanine ligase [Verrucomicrobiota bacterium]MDA1088107.1 D-alanine--D-alanine ligase [Verrucomicrobiota bacterium]
MRRFQHIAVLKGGPSAEREVSLESGAAVVLALRDAGYQVADIDVIDTDFDLPDDVEAVFVALHGTFGEDGGAQSLLARRGMPYTGSGPEASRIAFDKVETKKILTKMGISTPEFEILGPDDARVLALPVVVKPIRQGSSVGVHCVRSEEDWSPALADAISYDGEVLVERYIAGKELTVSILADTELPLVEIQAPDGWYDYGAKYTKGVTRYRVPAPIGAELTTICHELGRRAFAGLGCRGFGRVDIRLGVDEQPYVLEVNTIPGFTETSLVPKAAAAVGIDFSALCSRIVELATVS